MTKKRKDKLLKKLDILDDVIYQLRDLSKIPDKYTAKLDEESKGIISEWYKSYDPNMYRRQGSLKDAYRIIQDGFEISVDFDPEYMSKYKHHQENRIIFNNSFVFGYHGGSWGVDKNGVDSGVIPQWRTYPGFATWYMQAEKTTSPYNDISAAYHRIIGVNYMRRMDKGLDEIDGALAQCLD